MKYSIVIPFHNARKTIDRCLESALNQSLPKGDYEIIVVDDGSRDNTSDIVKNYPVRLMQQENNGPAAARNKGAKVAKGYILIFVDADCELEANFIKNISAPIEQNVEIIGVQGRYKTKQREFIAQFIQAEIETRYQRMGRDKYIDFVGTYAAAYRKDVFLESGGFDLKFPQAAGEDIDLSYRLYKKGSKMVFKPAAFVYHQHPVRLKEYLKSKFYKSFWRVKAYRKAPKKALRDSYTPPSLKVQVLSFAVFLLFGVLSIFDTFWLVIPFIVFLSFWLHAIPFFKLLKEKWHREILLIPIILFLRSLVSFFGLLFGTMRELVNRN